MSPAAHPALMGPHADVLAAFLDTLRAETSYKTWDTYRKALRHAQRTMPHGVVAATEPEIRAWIWGRDLSPQSRATYTSAVTRLHRWMHERGVSDHDPTTGLTRPRIPRRLPRPVPLDQVRVILTATRWPERLWCAVMYYTGARCVEVANLDRQDITEQTVRLDGKGGKDRHVPTHPALWTLVADLPAGPVADVRAADRAHAISQRVNRQIRRVGPHWRPAVTAHRLRHTLATEALAAGADLREVQEILGHSSPAVTAIYTAVRPERLTAAIRGVPDVSAAT